MVHSGHMGRMEEKSFQFNGIHSSIQDGKLDGIDEKFLFPFSVFVCQLFMSWTAKQTQMQTTERFVCKKGVFSDTRIR